jgi:blocked early in transport 1
VFSAYPGGGAAQSSGQFRAATPNSRGQYSDAVLSELESQNEEQLEGMSAKVKMLKDVSFGVVDYFG